MCQNCVEMDRKILMLGINSPLISSWCISLRSGWIHRVTWWARRSLPAVGWRVSRSSPTEMLQLTQQTLQHTTQHWFIRIVSYASSIFAYSIFHPHRDKTGEFRVSVAVPSSSPRSLSQRWPGGWGRCAPCILLAAAGNSAARWISPAWRSLTVPGRDVGKLSVISTAYVEDSLCFYSEP